MDENSYRDFVTHKECEDYRKECGNLVHGKIERKCPIWVFMLFVSFVSAVALGAYGYTYSTAQEIQTTVSKVQRSVDREEVKVQALIEDLLEIKLEIKANLTEQKSLLKEMNDSLIRIEHNGNR